MPAPDSGVVTIKVPFALRKRGGRKLVLAPDGAPMPPAAAQVDTTLVKAIARAFRWQKMLETGRYATINQGGRESREDQSLLCQPGAAVDPAGADDGRGDFGGARERGAETRGGHGAASGRVA